MQEEKIIVENIDANIQKKEVNKETATYFLFMKKCVKNNIKISSYVGSDHFDPAYIEGRVPKSDSDDDDTYIYSEDAPMVNEDEMAPEPGKHFIKEI